MATPALGKAARALQLAGLISPNYTSAAAPHVSGLPETWHWEWQWTGGDAMLVQLGDVVDRGHDSLALLGLLQRLGQAAEAAGGRVQAILGNHELMLVRVCGRAGRVYVSREELRAIGAAARLPPLWPGAGGSASGSSSDAHSARVGDDSRGGTGTSRGLAGNSAAAAEQPSGHHLHSVPQPDPTAEQQQGVEKVAQVEAEEEEERSEDESLRGELPAGHRVSMPAPAAGEPGPRRQPDHDRELRLRRLRESGLADSGLSATKTASDRASSSGSAISSGSRNGGSVATRWRQLLHQEPHPEQQEQKDKLLAQMRAGLELWQAGLAPSQPLGALVRRRPLALLAKGGGCEVLVVHAGAFPWMLTAVERALGVGEQGDQQQDGNKGGAGAGTAATGRLTPQQYVDAWNAVALEALVHCDGRWCRHGGEQAVAGNAGLQEGSRSGRGGEPASARWRYRRELAELLLGGEGAVWSRRYIQAPNEQVCAEVAAVAERLGVQRVVVGHTVQRGGRVSSRCGGQLLMVDVGLSRAIAGEMAVLTCSNGVLRAVYGEGQEQEL
eukprot:XP_001694993.1 set/thr protein phosphatase [Chlamydomonas reinhardtii]